MISREKRIEPPCRDETREFDSLARESSPCPPPKARDGVIVWAPSDARSGPALTQTRPNTGKDEWVDILFLAARPRSTTRLDLEKEAADIFRKVERVRHLKRVFLRATQIDDLTHCLLRHRPTIVHFGGHGSPEGKLFLEDEKGDAAPINVAALGRLIKEVGGVRCVVLNACFSAEHASTIAQHVPCVVAMSAAIADAAAITFSSTFYEALAFGEGVEKAFQLACSMIDLHVLPNADVPRLLFREGVNPADVRIFDNPEVAPAAPLDNPAPNPLRAIAAAVGLILIIMAILATLRSLAWGVQ